MEGVGRLLFGDRVVALSHAAAADVRAAGGRVDRVIPPGLDADAVEREAGAAHAEEGAPVVLFPGDPGPRGGARELVRAFALAAREAPGARLVLAMRPKTAAAAAEAEALREEARASGLEGRVEVLGEVAGFRARLRSAAIVALPAADLRGKLDYPYVLLEAMALGRPVVVSALPPLVELLALGGGEAPGLSAPVGDVPSLARALVRLLCDPAERRARGAAGAALVRRHLDPRAAAAAYVELYRELA
jgi:glycosyltransferase involved in cell wall biosynthesis